MLTSRTLFVLLTTLFLALGTACGDSSSQDDNNGGGADAGNNGGADVDEVAIPQDWTYASEYHVRFTGFRFDQNTPGADLNTLLRDRISKQDREYPIVVLVHLKDIDTDAGSLAFRGGAGQKAELSCYPGEEFDGVCAYNWHEDTAQDYTAGVPFDAQTGAFSAELDSFDFVATFDADTEATIPITDLTIDADLLPVAYEDEGGEVVVEVAIKNGTLVGIVTKEDADASLIKLPGSSDPKPLSELLGTDSMNFDSDGDDTMDAWKLSSSFTAEEALVVE